MRAPTIRSSAPRRAGDLEFVEHRLDVPLDHAEPSGARIEVFAREVVAVEHRGRPLPTLVWFQGGPGNRADRPLARGGWLKRAVQDHRVLLIDQRGTGRSTPVTAAAHGHLEPAALAAVLRHHRADAIVDDAEALRAALGIDRWRIIGQSFGGFVCVTYLSRRPAALEGVVITAGLPSLSGGADAVYRDTYRQTARRNDEFFRRHPGAEATAQAVAAHLAEVDERLPTGERLTPERFSLLGIQLGAESGFEALGYQLEEPFVRTARGPRLNDRFLAEIGGVLSFAPRPLYAVVHESIYGDGAATSWSAHRMRDEFPEFALDRTADDGPFRFTGEMVYPWQFEQDPALVPFRETADLLAAHEGWPALVDPGALAANEVPVAAAVYVDDMFVPVERSLDTARTIRGIELEITNRYQHDGIRQDGEALVGRLLDRIR